MNESIRIRTESGKYLTVDYSGNEFKEFYIGLEDEDGVWIQDLAVVREKYSFGVDESEKYITKPVKGIYEVLVYADKDSEDYTHKFSIDEWSEE